MTSAYVLIAAILLLGGLLATLGDRLGSGVGKARLRLFKLRPRQTAVVITVVTGIFISASTLGILFALSESLRQGVFDLDKIKKQRRQVEEELASVTTQKKQVEDELLKATEKQQKVNLLLTEVNRKFQTAQKQLNQVSTKARNLDIEVKKLVTEREQLQQLRNQLKTQVSQLEIQSTQLRTRISQLQNQVATQNKELLAKEQNILDKEQTIFEKQKTINQQEQTISQKEKDIRNKEQLIQQKQREIAEKQDEINLKTNILASKEIELKELEKKANNLEIEITLKDKELQAKESELKIKDQELQVKEASLQELQTQLDFLKREVAILEQYYQNYQVLRQGNLALLRGQVLAFAAVRIVKPEIANEAIDQLLSQANRNAIKVTQPLNPDITQRVVQITNSQVTQLIDQIKDGQDYVVRILSAGNYVQGENQIRVFADVAPNKLVYENNDLIATVSLETNQINDEELDQKLDLVIAATRFRARRAGILGDIQIEDGSLILLINFLETLKKSVEPIDEIRAVASDRTFSAGPLKIRLLALDNGKVIYSTSSQLTINN